MERDEKDAQQNPRGSLENVTNSSAATVNNILRVL